ncbi:hypothetical protein ACMFMF_001145 [Clarireedia jacksonii]
MTRIPYSSKQVLSCLSIYNPSFLSPSTPSPSPLHPSSFSLSLLPITSLTTCHQAPIMKHQPPLLPYPKFIYIHLSIPSPNQSYLPTHPIPNFINSFSSY